MTSSYQPEYIYRLTIRILQIFNLDKDFLG